MRQLGKFNIYVYFLIIYTAIYFKENGRLINNKNRVGAQIKV